MENSTPFHHYPSSKRRPPLSWECFSHINRAASNALQKEQTILWEQAIAMAILKG